MNNSTTVGQRICTDFGVDLNLHIVDLRMHYDWMEKDAFIAFNW